MRSRFGIVNTNCRCGTSAQTCSATQPAFSNIRYADGSEELYDMENDPQEWKNLTGDPQHAAIIAEHCQWLPKVDSPPAPGSQHRILTYDPATREAVWEGKKIEPEKRIE